MSTAAPRQQSLDVLRGVAVLGILMANAASFSGPMMDVFEANRQTHGWDAVEGAFVNGKFRSMLSILFGMGVWLQFERFGNDPRGWPWLYLKRCLILFALGLFHATLVWPGDILTSYAFAAAATCLLVKLPDRRLWAIVIAGLLLTMLCAGGLSAMMLFSDEAGNFYGELAAQELAAVQSRNPLQIMGSRFQLGAATALQSLFLLPLTVPLFVLGVLMAKHRALTGDSASWTRGLAIAGLIGLILNGLALTQINNTAAGPVYLGIDFGLSALLACGYLLFGAWLVRKLNRGLGWLAKVGRVSLTTYLGQSLIMNHLFIITGWYGRATPLQVSGAVLGVWLFNVLFAQVWLRYADIGPMEWVLRSLTEGKRLPWRKPPAVQITPEPSPAFDV